MEKIPISGNNHDESTGSDGPRDSVVDAPNVRLLFQAMKVS